MYPSEIIIKSFFKVTLDYVATLQCNYPVCNFMKPVAQFSNLYIRAHSHTVKINVPV
jgi:hypothetical protein